MDSVCRDYIVAGELRFRSFVLSFALSFVRGNAKFTDLIYGAKDKKNASYHGHEFQGWLRKKHDSD